MKKYNGKKPSEYFYGVASLKDNLENEGYENALKIKIQLSEILLGNLLDINYLKRDFERINDIIKCQNFNRDLINEIK